LTKGSVLRRVTLLHRWLVAYHSCTFFSRKCTSRRLGQKSIQYILYAHNARGDDIRFDDLAYERKWKPARCLVLFCIFLSVFFIGEGKDVETAPTVAFPSLCTKIIELSQETNPVFIFLFVRK
jgi:hypothetical protein